MGLMNDNMIVYLDNCCYNRPFDDRTNIKNYLEREAVLLVMQMAFDGNYQIIGSEVLEKEMSMISNREKRKNVEILYYSMVNEIITISDSTINRAKDIMKESSIKAFDSLHLASAETKADILLTTDIKFIKAANKLKLKIRVQNPISFLLEVNDYEYNNSSGEKQ